MNPLRRTALAEPGEQLLLSQSPLMAATRLDKWSDYTGIPVEMNVSSPLVAVPVPIYPQQWEQGQRRWPAAVAEAMWHPLMWLPPKLAGRYIIDADTEPDDVWAVRVAYELSAAGIYDPDTGSWLDMLSTVDVNIDTPADVERVSRWLSGAKDADLDGLNLDALLAQTPAAADDPDWAVHQACDEIDQLKVIAWATAAETLLDHATDLSDSPDEQGKGAALIADLASVAFAGIPKGNHATTSESAWWSSIAALVTDDPSTEDAVISAVTGRLTELRDHYRPQLEALATAGVPA